MHLGMARFLSTAVSTIVVLAAFGLGLRYLAGRALGYTPGLPRLRLPGPNGPVTVSLSRLLALAMLLMVRFAAGAPLGRRRTDATFLSPGTQAIGGVPGWFSTAGPGRWAFRPGWQRAAIRWAAVLITAGLLTHPLVTAIVLAGPAAAGGVTGWPRFTRWRYERRITRPVYLQLCQYLGTGPGERPGRWLGIPPGFATDAQAVVTLAYPPVWNPDAGKQKGIDEVIRRHLGGDLTGVFGPHRAIWAHPPAPPEVARFDGYDLPAHKVHLATLPDGRKWIADLQDEEPHLFIAAGTGGGKTATASIPAAHCRANGWLVDIIDPKRRSYIDRKTGADVLTNVPGIRVHTDIESMMWALEEFFLSMLGVNIAVGTRQAWPGAFPGRLLVIDEFGTFASMAARMHTRAKLAGSPAALDQRRQIEWQGRQAGHRLVLAVHQPNLRLFGDSDSRGQYGYRLITGAFTSSLWRMTFGYAPVIQWDARIKGRGVVGVGEADSLIHHAQITWMPHQERRRYALTGPPPPDWFTSMRPAPWITPHVIDEGRKVAGVALVEPGHPGPAAPGGGVPADVPPRHQTPPPAETPPDVPSDVPPADTRTPPPEEASPAGRRPGRHRAGPPGGQPVTSTGRGGRHRATTPEPGPAPAGPSAPAGEPASPFPAGDGGGDLITGIADAASYLGYTKPDSFRRARTRHPIPGETTTPDGRPAWTPAVLRSWQSRRKIAGRRPGSG